MKRKVPTTNSLQRKDEGKSGKKERDGGEEKGKESVMQNKDATLVAGRDAETHLLDMEEALRREFDAARKVQERILNEISGQRERLRSGEGSVDARYSLTLDMPDANLLSSWWKKQKLASPEDIQISAHGPLTVDLSGVHTAWIPSLEIVLEVHEKIAEDTSTKVVLED